MRPSAHAFSDGTKSPEGSIFARTARRHPANTAIVICLLLITGTRPARSAAPGLAQDSKPTTPPTALPTNGLVHQVGANQFAVGHVRLDNTAATISFPAVVNLRQGPVEYLVVTDYGKIHESLLRTTAAPYHIHLALLLLGLHPHGPTAFTNLATTKPSRSPPMPPPDLRIEISWTENQRLRRTTAGRHVLNRRARKPVGHGHWLFTGSRFREDGFAAQSDGSIISLIDDPDAIIANALPGCDDDDNWLATGTKLPPPDSPVEVTLKLLRRR